MKDLSNIVAYRFRWIYRALCCRYCNLFPPLLTRDLQTLHQEQRKNWALFLKEQSNESVQLQKDFDGSIQNSLSLLKNLRPKTSLELGCDTGWFSDKLKLLFPDIFYVGIDMDPRNFTFPGRRLAAANAAYLPFKSKCFDLIIAQQMFEHIHDVSAFSKELKSISKKETAFLISVPLGFDRDPCHRWHFMTPWGWKRFLKKKYGLHFVKGGKVGVFYQEFCGVYEY